MGDPKTPPETTGLSTPGAVGTSSSMFPSYRFFIPPRHPLTGEGTPALGPAANGCRVPRRRGKLAAIALCCLKEIREFCFAERICNAPPITQAAHGPLIHY